MIRSTSKWCIKQWHSEKNFVLNTDLKVGRTRDCQIRLSNMRCSKVHAIFALTTEGHMSIQDLKSSNGVFVNGKQIRPFDKHRLCHGSIVSMGISNIEEVTDANDLLSIFTVTAEQIPQAILKSMLESSNEHMLSDWGGMGQTIKTEPVDVIEIEDDSDNDSIGTYIPPNSINHDQLFRSQTATLKSTGLPQVQPLPLSSLPVHPTPPSLPTELPPELLESSTGLVPQVTDANKIIIHSNNLLNSAETGNNSANQSTDGETTPDLGEILKTYNLTRCDTTTISTDKFDGSKLPTDGKDHLLNEIDEILGEGAFAAMNVTSDANLLSSNKPAINNICDSNYRLSKITLTDSSTQPNERRVLIRVTKSKIVDDTKSRQSVTANKHSPSNNDLSISSSVNLVDQTVASAEKSNTSTDNISESTSNTKSIKSLPNIYINCSEMTDTVKINTPQEKSLFQEEGYSSNIGKDRTNCPTATVSPNNCEFPEENGSSVVKKAKEYNMKLKDSSKNNDTGIVIDETTKVLQTIEVPSVNAKQSGADETTELINIPEIKNNKPTHKSTTDLFSKNKDLISLKQTSPIYIDMTNDSDDDEVDIGSSQIAMMSAQVKTEVGDECFRFLKENFPDCYDSELEVNVPAPINTTQDVLQCLDPNNSYCDEGWKAINANQSTEIDQIINEDKSSCNNNVQQIGKDIPSTTHHLTEKEASSEWFVNNQKPVKRSTQSLIEAPKVKKVRKTSFPLPRKEALCDSKSIKDELKKRRSIVSDFKIDKSGKEAIKALRRKKLKAIFASGTVDLNPGEKTENNNIPRNEEPQGVAGSSTASKVRKTLQHTNRGEFLCSDLIASQKSETIRKRKESVVGTKVQLPKVSNNATFKIPKICRNLEKVESTNEASTSGNKFINETTLDQIVSEYIRNTTPPTMNLNIRQNFNIDGFDIIEKILQWHPEWLALSDFNPPINNPPATQVPLNFNSSQQYYDIFTKLLLLENWQYMYNGFREGTAQLKLAKSENLTNMSGITCLQCSCILTAEDEKQQQYIRNDDVVVVEYRLRNKQTSLLVFGFVTNLTRKKITENDLIPEILASGCAGVPHVNVNCTIIIKGLIKESLNFMPCLMIKPLLNINALLKQVRVINQLFKSQLGAMILDPDRKHFTFPVTHKSVLNIDNMVNSKQKTFIMEATSHCIGNTAGMYCIQGPPGTGKTFVIVNIVFQILSTYYSTSKDDDAPVILLTAPSNAVVDNLMSKLLQFKHRLPDYAVRMVRIGPDRSMSPEARSHSLFQLASEYLPDCYANLDPFKKAKERSENMIEFAKQYFGKDYYNVIKKCEDVVLKRSNIFCTTLNSCVNGRLIDAVERRLINFSCCIIDEATQCHEIESILPVLLGIEKLVLVGDPKQLNATILSREASNLGLENSFLTRLANKFEHDLKSPIRMLTNQYRMHKEICSFPSKQFYKGLLRTYTDPRKPLYSKIKPYLVFTCGPCENSEDYTNETEMILIKNLLNTIFNILGQQSKYTIGIITPYNAQKVLIESNVAILRLSNTQCNMKVNTVDSFQGSEEDIIIISCVRKSSNLFVENANRLNVALTRARHALYIFGNEVLFEDCAILKLLKIDAQNRKVLVEIGKNKKNISDFDFKKYVGGTCS